MKLDLYISINVRGWLKMKKDRRGFASMNPDKQRRIASKGGIAAHKKGTAHEWTIEEASAAGKIGGRKSKRVRLSI